MVGTLTNDEIDKLVADQLFGRLGCHADGRTYVVPISFAIDKGNLVGQTTLGLKIEMMRANPEVCVEIDDIKDLTNWRSVIIRGQYEEMEGMEAIEAMDLLIDRYGPVFERLGSPDRVGRQVKPERLDHQPAPLVVYRIRVSDRSGRFERSI